MSGSRRGFLGILALSPLALLFGIRKPGLSLEELRQKQIELLALAGEKNRRLYQTALHNASVSSGPKTRTQLWEQRLSDMVFPKEDGDEALS